MDESDIAGYASYVNIIEVNRPHIAGEKGSEICLADNGYSELTFLPDHANWMLSAIYDAQNDIVGWYIDITRKMRLTKKDSHIVTIYIWMRLLCRTARS